MSPRTTLSLLVVFLVALSACQTYTSGLQQSVARADETGAIAALRAISLAQRTYSITNSGEYGTLQQLTDGGFLDVRFAKAKPLKDYSLTLKVTPKSAGAPEGSYACNGDPDKAGAGVGRHLYIDSTSGEIHVNETQPATATDKPLQ